MTVSLPKSGEPLSHYVSTAPFDPHSVDVMSAEQSQIHQASQLRLMWWKFKKHRLALFSMYFPRDPLRSDCHRRIPWRPITCTPAMSISSIRRRKECISSTTAISSAPSSYGRTMTLDMDTLRRNYTEDRSKVQPIRFFCSGDNYRFWGLFEANTHFACPAQGGELFLLGSDRLGRDVLSRILYGARISLTIGLLGITMSFVLGITIGGLAGYHGGVFDLITQRIIEVLQSIPSIPLWMALAAIMPVTWSPILIYLGITAILGLLDWTGLARAVRSKLLALREEDYVLAAQLMGAGSSRIIGRHLVPGFMSHLIATATLAIPGMILGETALSFLGLGLRPPITSWGILLTEARSVSVIAFYPWLLFPTIPVILVILAFNFLGDGLRDAADPYK